ncbi:MAG: hypothetical protein L6Q57_04230 [Alphaproteobacteria bacterium]|nr:hypothetical protein [Alphaproteobacteria bacterium]
MNIAGNTALSHIVDAAVDTVPKNLPGDFLGYVGSFMGGGHAVAPVAISAKFSGPTPSV